MCSILTDLQKIFKELQKVICQLIPLIQTVFTIFFGTLQKKNWSKHQASTKLRVETTNQSWDLYVLAQKNDPLFLWMFLGWFFWGGGTWRMCSCPSKKNRSCHSTRGLNVCWRLPGNAIGQGHNLILKLVSFRSQHGFRWGRWELCP